MKEQNTSPFSCDTYQRTPSTFVSLVHVLHVLRYRACRLLLQSALLTQFLKLLAMWSLEGKLLGSHKWQVQRDAWRQKRNCRLIKESAGLHWPVNVGGCSLHHIHNMAKHTCDSSKLGTSVEALVRDTYCHFRYCTGEQKCL